jgi:hypothetical protein
MGRASGVSTNRRMPKRPAEIGTDCLTSTLGEAGGARPAGEQLGVRMLIPVGECPHSCAPGEFREGNVIAQQLKPHPCQ